MNNRTKEAVREISKKLDNKKAVKVNDSYGTIIYVSKGANEKRAIKKYLKDLEDYRLAGAKNLSKKRS